MNEEERKSHVMNITIGLVIDKAIREMNRRCYDNVVVVEGETRDGMNGAHIVIGRFVVPPVSKKRIAHERVRAHAMRTENHVRRRYTGADRRRNRF